MPEGDVVWRTARDLDRALASRELTTTDFRVPRFATADLRGREVAGVVSRGKHLLARVEGDVTIHTHLKMDGSWRVTRLAGSRPDGSRPVSTSAATARHTVRLVLANREWLAVGDSLGLVELVRTSQEQTVIGHLGPDLLGPDWDGAEAVRRILMTPTRPIGEALLDQRNLAGIGTIYLAETLFLSGVQPSRPCGEVADLSAVVETARRLLDLGKERVGQVTTGIDRPGQRTWVYGRARRPCWRCGTPVKSARLGSPARDRVAFWCPRCQR